MLEKSLSPASLKSLLQLSHATTPNELAYALVAQGICDEEQARCLSERKDLFCPKLSFHKLSTKIAQYIVRITRRIEVKNGFMQVFKDDCSDKSILEMYGKGTVSSFLMRCKLRKVDPSVA